MARLVPVTDDPNQEVQANALPAMRHWKWAAASCLVSAGLILLLSVALQLFVVLAPFFMQWVVDQALVSLKSDLFESGKAWGLTVVRQRTI